MPELYHVSDGEPLTVMHPRPASPDNPHEGRPLVWAVDDDHLANYLLPRVCPRVCWTVHPSSAGVLASPFRRVIVIEHRWLPRLAEAVLQVHHVEPDGFVCVDPVAGYWVCEHDVRVRDVVHVDDCVTALAERQVELRIVTSIWPYVDAVVQAGGEFSVIRARHAAPRPEPPGR